MDEFFSNEPKPRRSYHRLTMIALGISAFFVISIGLVFGLGWFGPRNVATAPRDRFPDRMMAAVSETIGGLMNARRDERDTVVDLNAAAAPVYGTSNNFTPKERSDVPPPSLEDGSLSKEGAPATRETKKSDVSPTPSDSKTKKEVASISTPFCNFETTRAATRKVLLSEIAWMGAPAESGQSAGAASAHEWLELKNISKSNIDLAGWQIVERDGDLKIDLDGTNSLPAGGFYLIERSSDATVPTIAADSLFTGSLSNAGVWLKLFDASCELVDEMNALTGWPGGDNTTKKTLERAHDNIGWQTSAVTGGTPRSENSDPVTVGPAVLGATTDPPTTTDPNPITKYRLTVYVNGAGHGEVMSIPAGINCGDTCSVEAPVGASLLLKAVPAAGSYLAGWSSPCAGAGDCGISLSGNTYVSAQFNLESQRPGSAPSGGSGGGVSAAGAGSVLVSEIQAGTSVGADDEFIELYNPGSTAIELTGWSIKKKTSNGTESVLVPASRDEGLKGRTIQPGKYLLLTNQEGYAGSVLPDGTWATSNNFAYTNNTLTLFDGAGTKIDEVSWASIPSGKSFARVSWSGSEFTLLDVPTPNNSTY